MVSFKNEIHMKIDIVYICILQHHVQLKTDLCVRHVLQGIVIPNRHHCQAVTQLNSSISKGKRTRKVVLMYMEHEVHITNLP